MEKQGLINAKRKKRYICLDLEMCELTSKQRKSVKGMRCEVIQIGAVMLDENLNCISQFSSFVKPEYGQISKTISLLTGITPESVEHADSFTTAFYKLVCWAGNDDITTFCWSDSDYSQLWDEIYIKAKNHDEYRNFLKTFVDLQAIFGRLLKSEYSISLDTALKYCHLKFNGQRHSAIFDAFNTARILFKLNKIGKIGNEWTYIASYTESEMSKRYSKLNSLDKDYTSSFASFISPDVLEKFGYSRKEVENLGSEKKIETQFTSKKTIIPILKLFDCSRYGINVSDWLKFSVRMRFVGDLKISNSVDFLAG